VASVVVSRDLLIGLFYFSIVAVAGGFRPITPSLVGKGCTMFQMLTLVALMAAPPLEGLVGAGGMGALFNGLFLITVFMTLVSGIDYLYAARLSLIAPDRVALIQTNGPDGSHDAERDPSAET